MFSASRHLIAVLTVILCGASVLDAKKRHPHNLPFCEGDAEAVAADRCKLTKDEIDDNKGLEAKAAAIAIYAVLSNNAYADHPQFALPDGWKPTNEKRLTGDGLNFQVYENESNKPGADVVIAFRGTETWDAKDWIQDFTIKGGKQMAEAESLYQRLLKGYQGRNPRFTATGHSLGGALAMHLSLKYPNVNAVAFNSAPFVQAGKHPVENKRINIWESKEILRVTRNRHLGAFKWSKDATPLKFRFQHGPCAITQHKMYALALSILKLANTEENLSPDMQALAARNCFEKSAP